MTAEMTSRACRSHVGTQYTISTARDIMYWPRMSADLTEAVQRCETRQQRKPALPREPLMTYPIPSLPWKIVASDCFEIMVLTMRLKNSICLPKSGTFTAHFQRPSTKSKWESWICSQDHAFHHSILTKANKQEEDMWKAILKWTNASTPSQHSFLVQCLKSRWTRSFLPCARRVAGVDHNITFGHFSRTSKGHTQ